MAEALLRGMGGGGFEVHSAGIEEEVLSPLAVEAMHEIGIEAGSGPTQALNDFEDLQFDYVISLCDEVKSACLSFPRDAHNLHWSCPDPTLEEGTRDEQLAAFRRTREQLQQQLKDWLAEMEGHAK